MDSIYIFDELNWLNSFYSSPPGNIFNFRLSGLFFLQEAFLCNFINYIFVFIQFIKYNFYLNILILSRLSSFLLFELLLFCFPVLKEERAALLKSRLSSYYIRYSRYKGKKISVNLHKTRTYFF